MGNSGLKRKTERRDNENKQLRNYNFETYGESITGNCPLCGEEKFSSWRFELLLCKSCSIVFSPKVWTLGIEEQMEDKFFGSHYVERKVSFWVDLFEGLNNRRVIRRLARLHLTGKRLLEIGVGSGSFLSYARKAGFYVTGCDLSPSISRKVEQRHGIPVRCCKIEDLAEGERYDIVVANHVLEHVQRPISFLSSINRVLNEGGVVHIAVPNLRCWEARLPGWIGYQPYHLLYFSPETLKIAIEQAGLYLEKSITHESFSGWFLAILRTCLGLITRRFKRSSKDGILQTAVPRKTPSLMEHIYRSTMVLSGSILYPFRRFQSMLGRGDELVCIARKGNM
ncbi:MAG: class I SAM-dependent methyltransferase [Deltaproteobacteria bacterium]|nr:class I SAM-dependent methyltransferase [Deltaproteobacteria bacterium]